MDELFLKHDISARNKGFKIPLLERKQVMSKFFSRIYDLEVIPKQAALLFSGNSSRLQHSLFNDLTSSFDPDANVGVKQLILDFVRKTSTNKKKEILNLSREQLNFVFEFHKYAFNIKLGMELLDVGTSENVIKMKSKQIIKV